MKLALVTCKAVPRCGKPANQPAAGPQTKPGLSPLGKFLEDNLNLMALYDGRNTNSKTINS